MDKIDTVIGDYAHIANVNNNLGGSDIASDLDLIDAVIGNRDINSLNTALNNAVKNQDYARSFKAVGDMIGDMNFDQTRYLAGTTNLSDAVRALDNNLDRVEHRVNTVEREMNSGMAAMSAMSALVPNARDCGDTQVSVGTGAYQDRFGVAVGAFHYFNDHVLVNAGASYGGSRQWAVRAGITFGL